MGSEPPASRVGNGEVPGSLERDTRDPRDDCEDGTPNGDHDDHGPTQESLSGSWLEDAKILE